MTDRDRTAAGNAAQRARISALSAASLRISASLDPETVLNEVVESARALTGARYGAIATIDEAGPPPGGDFVTSGFDPPVDRIRLGVAAGQATGPGIEAIRGVPGFELGGPGEQPSRGDRVRSSRERDACIGGIGGSLEPAAGASARGLHDTEMLNRSSSGNRDRHCGPDQAAFQSGRRIHVKADTIAGPVGPRCDHRGERAGDPLAARTAKGILGSPQVEEAGTLLGHVAGAGLLGVGHPVGMREQDTGLGFGERISPAIGAKSCARRSRRGACASSARV